VSALASPQSQASLSKDAVEAVSKRILVVRLSAMGDIIHAMPAITALRAACPQLQIGWLVEERWAELLCARGSDPHAPRSQQKPLADWVHGANFAGWRRALLSGETWKEIGSLRREVRKMNYEVAVDLQGAIRSALAASAIGAKVRVGSRHPREAPATMFYTRQVEPRLEHVVEHALSIVSEIAATELRYMSPLFPIDLAAEAWADQMCAKLGSRPLAIINPGAGWGAKCWPAASFGAVACALGKRGLAIAVNHGPGEETLAETVRESSDNVAIPVKCSIGELIALTRRAHLFIGGDTGPMHLAAALCVPVIALFGPTRPERNGPYGTRSIVLRSPESIDNTTHTDRPDEGLTTLQPQAVIEAAEQLLGEARD